MKKTMVLIILVLLSFYYFTNLREDENIISSDSYDSALSLGLESEGNDKVDILFISDISDDEVIIFYQNNSAISLACISKEDTEWLWSKVSVNYGFDDSNKNHDFFNVKFKSIKSKEYFTYIGKIFDASISEIYVEYNEDLPVKATIVGDYYFASIYDFDKIVLSIKAYDANNNIIEVQ